MKLTPATNASVEHLRLLAVSRGIVLRPLRLRPARATHFAATLWMAALNTDSLEYASRFGRQADAVATTILTLAAGHNVKPVEAQKALPTWTTDRAALRRCEKALYDLLGPPGRYKDLPEILDQVIALFQPAGSEPRMLAVLDVTEALRDSLGD